MILPIFCFTKSAVNEWAHISKALPNQPDYPLFSKCTLNLGLENPVLINSIDMSHLSPFSHWSILGKFGAKNQICQFILKFGTKTNLNMQNSMVMHTFSVFDQKRFFMLSWSQNSNLFKVEFGT